MCSLWLPSLLLHAGAAPSVRPVGSGNDLLRERKHSGPLVQIGLLIILLASCIKRLPHGTNRQFIGWIVQPRQLLPSDLARPHHAGLELFFVDAPGAAAGGGPTWGAPSAFFAFGSEEERERAAAVLTGQPALGSSLPGGRSAAAAAGSILEVPLAYSGHRSC